MVNNEEPMVAKFGIVPACAWIVLLVIGQSASAEPASSGGEQVEARRLERFLRENHSQAVARNGRGFSVEANSGTVTIELRNDPDKCTSDSGVINKDVAVDVRALRIDGGDIARLDRITIVSFHFRSDAMNTLRSAYDAQKELIADARAEYGWGLAAAIAASETFTDRYGEALALYREDFKHCSGGHSVQISNPFEWTVALQPSADASEFVDLLERYQASLRLK
jgi:hypothetical protein